MTAGSNLAVGVDLGTTYTCAAVSEPPGASARVIQLTGTSQTIPSVVSITDDGVVAGDVAERRLMSHSASTAREFKRRLGDATPIVLGGDAYPAEVLTGHLLADVLDRVERNEGSRPAIVGLAHPASWGPFRLDLLRDAARQAGVDEVVLVPEPVAAAVANRSRVEDGSLIAVYDLGGGTFDAAVVRVGADAASSTLESDVAVVGTPEGVERLGGIDFDQAVMAHVDAVLGGQVFSLDSSDPEARSALMRLRAECQAAKEHLSEDSDVDIAVSLPSVQTSVRMTRAEFEAAVRPRLADSLAVFDRVVSSAGVGWGDISAVLLVGGSSNIPVVAQTVGEHTGRPVITATSPHLAIAIGTAMVAASSAGPDPASVVPPVVMTPVVPPVPDAEDRTVRRTGMFVGAALATVAALAVVAFLAFGGDSDDSADESTVAPIDTVPAATDSGPADSAPVESTPDDAAPPETAPDETVPDETAPDTTIAPSTGDVALEISACGLADADVLAVLPFDTGVMVVSLSELSFIEGADAAACALDLSAGSPVDALVPTEAVAATSAGNLFAIAGRGDGVIGSVETASTRECGLIDGPVSMNNRGAVFRIGSDGSIARIRTLDGECSSQDADAFADITATAIGIGASDRLAVGGDIDGERAVRVFSDPESSVDIVSSDVPGGFGSVDSLVRCGSAWCVIDLTRQAIHVLAPDGVYLGATPLAGTDLADAVAVRSAVIAPDGGALLTAERSDGTVVVARVTIT